MKNISKLFIIETFAVVLSALFLFPITAHAQKEETFVVEMYEYDDGIYLPKEYKVIDEQGRFATFGVQDDFAGGQLKMTKKGEDRVEILDNGYLLDVYWMDCSEPSVFGSTASDDDEVWCQVVSVYDENDELMFFNGWTVSYLEINKGFKYEMTLSDPNGSYINEQYSRPTMSPNVNDREFGDIPLCRRTWDKENKIARDYNGFHVKEGDVDEVQFRLSMKYDYSESVNGLVTSYNMAWGGPEYDEDEDYYRMYTFYTDDVYCHGVARSVDNGVMIKGLYISDVIYPAFSDEPLYLRIYPKREESYPEEPIADKVLYMTKEHIDILDAEGIRYYSEILEKHPEFKDDEFNATVRFEVMGSDEPTQAELEQKAREDAVIKGQVEENTDSDTTDDSAENDDARKESAGAVKQAGGYSQELVGDVVPINGKVPVRLFTHEVQTGIGLTLYDANNQIVASYMGESWDHINYKYAYLTWVWMIDNGGCVFTVAGTNTPVTGNLGSLNYGEVETENGMSHGTSYGGDTGYSGENYPEENYSEEYYEDDYYEEGYDTYAWEDDTW